MITNDNLIKNLKNSNSSNNLKEVVEKLEKTKQEEIFQLESRYQTLLTEKDLQHKEFLEEIDQLMLEQENEINEIKQKNYEFVAQLRELQEENLELRKAILVKNDNTNRKKLPETSDQSEDLLVINQHSFLIYYSES